MVVVGGMCLFILFGVVFSMVRIGEYKIAEISTVAFAPQSNKFSLFLAFN